MYAAVPTVLFAPVSAGHVHVFGDAEIRELDCAVGQDHDVRRLQIPVNDPLHVRMLKSGAELLAECDDFLPRITAAAGEHLVERFALDQFHGEERRLLVMPGGDQPGDVRMLQLLEDLAFALEAGDGRLIAELREPDDLECDTLARFPKHSLVNGAHRPGAKLLFDVKRTDVFAEEHEQSQTSRRSSRFDSTSDRRCER